MCKGIAIAIVAFKNNNNNNNNKQLQETRGGGITVQTQTWLVPVVLVWSGASVFFLWCSCLRLAGVFASSSPHRATCSRRGHGFVCALLACLPRSFFPSSPVVFRLRLACLPRFFPHRVVWLALAPSCLFLVFAASAVLLLYGLPRCVLFVYRFVLLSSLPRHSVVFGVRACFAA